MKQFIEKHSHTLVALVTAIVLLGFSYQVMAYLFSLRKEPEKRPPIIPIRSVQCSTIDYGTLVSPVTASGRVVSTREVVLNSEVSGRILEGDVPLKKGQRFGKGDVLIRIFDGNAVMNLRARKSSFLQSIAGILPDLKVDYPESFGTWNAFFQSIDMEVDLPELPGIGTDQEKVFLASRGILTDYYSIKSDEITLKKYVIRAPFEGTFTDVNMEVGAYTGAGSTLARIIRTDILELEVPVESRDAKWILIGDKVHVATEDGSMSWEGTVVRTSDFVDVDTQSMSIFVRLPNGRKTPVFKGQYLIAQFPGREIENVMEVPRNAVFNHNEVFIVVDGKLMMETIDIHKINETTLIFSGLEPGAELVVEPLINTMENTRVEINR